MNGAVPLWSLLGFIYRVPMVHLELWSVRTTIHLEVIEESRARPLRDYSRNWPTIINTMQRRRGICIILFMPVDCSGRLEDVSRR